MPTNIYRQRGLLPRRQTDRPGRTLGEPDAVKAARPVRRGAMGNGLIDLCTAPVVYPILGCRGFESLWVRSASGSYF